jgi:hypothetical protein
VSPGHAEELHSARRRARRIEAAGFVLAAALPIVLWRGTISAIAADFRLEADYLITGWSPWILMAFGLLCFIPVAVADWQDPDRRFARRGTGAWSGWGVTLYVLGFLLATQVAQIADL